MNLTELKGKYARLRDEIDTFGGPGHQPNEAKLARLMRELDRVDEEFASIRRRQLDAPTLSDVVALEPLDLTL